MTIEISIEEVSGDLFGYLGSDEDASDTRDALMDILEERYGIETLVAQELERMRGDE